MVVLSNVLCFKNPSKHERGHVVRQWAVAVLANLTLLTYGLQRGWISPLAPLLLSDQSPTGSAVSELYLSWLASSPNISAMFTVPLFSMAADKYGRRICIIVVSVLQGISWILKFLPENLYLLMISQVICGLAGGGCFNVIPMYVKEISEDKTRGTLGVLLIMAQNLGIFALFALGPWLSYNTVLWIVTWIPFLAALLMIRAPESPAFLVKIGKTNDARTSIAWLRGLNADSQIVQNEMDIINKENERFHSIPDVSFLGILKQKAWLKGFLIMLMLMSVHGLNGGFAIINFTSLMLTDLKVTSNLDLLSLSVPVAMIFGSILSVILVGRFGRKVILSSTLFILMLSFCTLSATVLVQSAGIAVPQWVPVSVLVAGVTAYAAGTSPLPFVIMAEMFNFQIRSRLIGWLITNVWLLAFIQVFAYGPITTQFGSHVSYLCFGAINLFGFAVALVLLPETRNKTVEEIEMELEKKK